MWDARAVNASWWWISVAAACVAQCSQFYVTVAAGWLHRRGVYARGGGTGVFPQWLHSSPQLTVLYCQERPSWVLKIVENLWTVRTPPRTPLGELTALPQTPYLVGRGLLSPPQEPRTHCRLFGLAPNMKNPGRAPAAWGADNRCHHIPSPPTHRLCILPCSDTLRCICLFSVTACQSGPPEKRTREVWSMDRSIFGTFAALDQSYLLLCVCTSIGCLILVTKFRNSWSLVMISIAFISRCVVRRFTGPQKLAR